MFSIKNEQMNTVHTSIAIILIHQIILQITAMHGFDSVWCLINDATIYVTISLILVDSLISCHV